MVSSSLLLSFVALEEGTMSIAAETVVRNWFDEVWNQGREETIDRLLSTEAVAHGLPGGPTRGPQAFRSVFKSFRSAFPDLHVAVERTVTEGDVVAAYCHVTGTHTGDSLGVPATGKRVDFHGVTIARITDGTIGEGWNCFDFLTMYQQLGVLPAVPGS
jgi:steroid delta-isomerase-like uncharacterized protein